MNRPTAGFATQVPVGNERVGSRWFYASPMTEVAGTPNVEQARPRGLFHSWRYVLATTNPPPGRLDPVSKWLYLTRAGVLPMTLVAAAVAGLLAIYRDADVAWGWFALSALGIVLAHMANNLMNDLFDLEVGTDREDYPRNLYSPHPVLSGVITRRGLAGCALVVNAICLAIMVVLTVERGCRSLRSRSAGSCSRVRTPLLRCG